ncbi:MAG TPA: SIMPL domain-containing protein [Candidatus Paceibacterota bacterium]|nr:SIMPL domain-containing protein [Candidatus Paceibacterota bacterium]
MNEKRWFWILLDVLIAVAVVNIVFFVMPALLRLGNSFAPARTVMASAEGKTTVMPDIAESTFSVVVQGKNPQDLADSSNQKMSAVIKFLKSEGIADKDIATVAYDLSPNYRYDASTQRNYITGYMLTQTVDVKMRDFTKVAEIIGGLTPLGVNQIGNINFTVDNNETYLAVARADALKNAQAKAEQMAAAAGAHLGRAVNVSESQGILPRPIPYAMSTGMSAAAPQVATPTIQPGTQEITDDVTITYELE